MTHLPFERRVDIWTARKITLEISFADLLQQLPGVFPTAVLASIKRLGRTNIIDERTYKRLEHEAIHGHAPAIRDTTLPPPHPLNFEWRFTTESAIKILGRAAQTAPYGGEILLFGTPGVARSAITRKLPQKVMFFGEDNAVCDILELENERAGAPLAIGRCGSVIQEGNADAVIIDPPWYEDYVGAMLKSAAFSCKIGGTIHFALAPVGTARSTFEHREKVFALAQAYGLSFEALWEQYLDYDTPFFEANALNAAGLAAPPVWRCADLVTFRKTGRAVFTTNTNSLNQHRWCEASMGRMRIFVCAARAVDKANGLLSPVVPGEILPSVSRHDPRRREANVWTSGNRIYASSNPALVLEAAQLGLYGGQQITAGNNPEATEFSGKVLRLNEALTRVAEREGVEELRNMAREATCETRSTLRNYANASQITQIG